MVLGVKEGWDCIVGHAGGLGCWWMLSVGRCLVKHREKCVPLVASAEQSLVEAKKVALFVLGFAYNSVDSVAISKNKA